MEGHSKIIVRAFGTTATAPRRRAVRTATTSSSLTYLLFLKIVLREDADRGTGSRDPIRIRLKSLLSKTAKSWKGTTGAPRGAGKQKGMLGLIFRRRRTRSDRPLRRLIVELIDRRDG